MIEFVKYAMRTLLKQRARSILTLSGIIIGIAVIVAMVSIGEGLKYTMEETMDQLGYDMIYVMPGGLMGSLVSLTPTELVPFGLAEEKEIRTIPGVKSVSALYYGLGRVKVGQDEVNTYVIGLDDEGVEIYAGFFSIKEGRYINEDETGSVYIGSYVAHGLFERDVGIGSSIDIQGRKLRVVGILEEMGSREDDSSIYMSMTEIQNIFEAGDDITMFVVQVDSAEQVKGVALRMEERLKKIRGVKDFDIMSAEDYAGQVVQVMDILTVAMGSIASVSLLIGGVIIMNTMLMSVMERTNEIGVMKATGATDTQVIVLFLAESSIIGLVGGIMGITLGLLASKGLEMIMQFYIGSLFVTHVPLWILVGLLMFSVGIGVMSGVYPAWKAAKLDPVDALRYE